MSSRLLAIALLSGALGTWALVDGVKTVYREKEGYVNAKAGLAEPQEKGGDGETEDDTEVNDGSGAEDGDDSERFEEEPRPQSPPLEIPPPARSPPAASNHNPDEMLPGENYKDFYERMLKKEEEEGYISPAEKPYEGDGSEASRTRYLQKKAYYEARQKNPVRYYSKSSPSKDPLSRARDPPERPARRPSDPTPLSSSGRNPRALQDLPREERRKKERPSASAERKENSRGHKSSRFQNGGARLQLNP